MGGKKSTKNGQNWKNFDYHRAAVILKHSGFVNFDLRKNLTKYQKQRIRNLVKENNGAVFSMAKYREESKNRRRIEKLAGISQGKKLTPEYVIGKIAETQIHNPQKLSQSQLDELTKLHDINRKSILNNPNNYGLRNFTRKKVSKKEAELLKSQGWTVKNGHAYLPTLAYKTKSFLNGLYIYQFPNGAELPALVEHNYKRTGGKEFTYFIQAESKELTALINDLIEKGLSNLFPDILYTSPTKARENENASRVADLFEFMHYVGVIINKEKSDKARDQKADVLIEAVKIESNNRPTKKYK